MNVVTGVFCTTAMESAAADKERRCKKYKVFLGQFLGTKRLTKSDLLFGFA